jgi:hypothetical protein
LSVVVRSRSYNKYRADLDGGKKNSGEKKWAALRAAGRQGQAAVSARPAAVVQQQHKQLHVESVNNKDTAVAVVAAG